MKQAIKAIMRRTTTRLSRCFVNGGGWVSAGTVFMLAHIDDRRRVATRHGMFTVRTANPVERWRAETLQEKEPETIAWLDDTIEDDSVFYDVGANIGLYTLYASHLRQGGVRAVCFEPEAQNFARLNVNIADNGLSGRVFAFPVALGEANTPASFDLSAVHAGAALHGPRNVKCGTAAYRQGIMIQRLDDLMQHAALFPPPTHLKVDVDGPELAVLRGAQATLGSPALRHVLVEVDEGERDAAVALLAAHGFVQVAAGLADGGMQNCIFRKADSGMAPA